MKTAIFQQRLLRWFRHAGRTLPWRTTHDPYKILVSEIMLQQTQVERVKEYYARFLKQFPTAAHLAVASDGVVLTLWSGLGYNRRALNLKKAAQVLGDKPFPQTVEELTQLPGIGPYTAGAVLTFAFNKRVVFADVNIRRVIERFFGVPAHHVPNILHELVEHIKSPHTLYSALMDFGALLCISKPLCGQCPLKAACAAYPAILQQPQRNNKKPATKKFLGSNRWWRGQILKALIVEAKSEQKLYRHIVQQGIANQKQFLLALAELEEEGMIKKRDGAYSV